MVSSSDLHRSVHHSNVPQLVQMHFWHRCQISQMLQPNVPKHDFSYPPSSFAAYGFDVLTVLKTSIGVPLSLSEMLSPSLSAVEMIPLSGSSLVAWPFSFETLIESFPLPRIAFSRAAAMSPFGRRAQLPSRQSEPAGTHSMLWSRASSQLRLAGAPGS